MNVYEKMFPKTEPPGFKSDMSTAMSCVPFPYTWNSDTGIIVTRRQNMIVQSDYRSRVGSTIVRGFSNTYTDTIYQLYSV